MQNSTLFQSTPEELVELLLIGIKAELKSFKESLAPGPADELLIQQEACDFLKVGPVTLWRWQKQGRINVYKISKINYYKKTELLDCLKLSKK